MNKKGWMEGKNMLSWEESGLDLNEIRGDEDRRRIEQEWWSI